MDLENTIADRAESDGSYAIAYALLRVAYALRMLGNADAATPMGALEALGGAIKEGLESLSDSIGCLENEFSRFRTDELSRK